MPSLVRLAYASSTTSKPASIRNDLINILKEAQNHNSQHHISGVLYYGNDCFFQCLEGDKTQVDLLYKKLLGDPRHNNIKLLSYETIEQVNFSQWSMKYVLQDQSILNFFQNEQWEKFNPYALEQPLIQPFLGILLQHAASEPGLYEQVIEFPADELTQNLTYKYAVFLLFIVLAALALSYVFSNQSSTGLGFFSP